MEDINEWLKGSSSLNLTFLVLAVLSLFASIIFYFNGRKEKIPVYLSRTFPLVKNNLSEIEGLSISFAGNQIKTLSLSRLSFWNKGRETIHGRDVVAADRLRLEVGGSGKIYGAKISFVRKEINGISVALENNCVIIGFDYLDHLDGFILDIYHASEDVAALKGTLKGALSISPAKIDEDYFLDKLEPLFNRLPSPPDGSMAEKLLIVLLMPIFIPIFVPLIAAEKAISMFQVVPRQYSLED